MLLSKLLSHLVVRVQPFALCHVSRGWRLGLPGPRGTMLHFVLEGRGIIRKPNGEKHYLNPYSLSVVPKGMAHLLETLGKVKEELIIDSPPKGEKVCQIVAGPQSERELVLACGLVHARFAESLGIFDYLNDIITVDFSDSDHVKTIFATILTEQRQSLTGSDTVSAALMTSCLVHLLRRLPQTGDATIPWLIALEDNRLGRAIGKILDEPNSNHTVESLANLAAMSRSVFAEKFTSAFGYPPMHFVQKLRMVQAAKLLLQDCYSIDHIAHKIGYSSRSHFSAAFKKQFGKSPADYRR